MTSVVDLWLMHVEVGVPPPRADCQEREGASDKTGVGRTKDDGADMVRRKPPERPRRRAQHPRQPQRFAPPVEVRTTPAETMKVRAMPTSTSRRGGVIGPHAHGKLGRQVADDQDNTRREQLGLTHTETRRGMWWMTWRGVGSKNRKTTPATASTTPSAPTTGRR